MRMNIGIGKNKRQVMNLPSLFLGVGKKRNLQPATLSICTFRSAFLLYFVLCKVQNYYISSIN